MSKQQSSQALQGLLVKLHTNISQDFSYIWNITNEKNMTFFPSFFNKNYHTQTLHNVIINLVLVLISINYHCKNIR